MKLFIFALIATLVTCSAAPVMARGGKWTACAGDIQKFCASSTSKHERRQCMKSHKTELSSACIEQIAANKRARRQNQTSEQPGTHS